MLDVFLYLSQEIIADCVTSLAIDFFKFTKYISACKVLFIIPDLNEIISVSFVDVSVEGWLYSKF